MANNLLVDADWLAAHLADPSVRIIDASVDIEPRPPGPSNYISRRGQFEASHIPGAAYLHMVEDLSDPAGPYPFAMPPAETVWATLSALGISNDHTIVLYGNAVHWAVHRCWWVIAAAGGRDVRLLNTTFDQWCAERRPVETGTREFVPAAFHGTPRSWLANKPEVVASLGDPHTALVNSLSADQFAGRGQPFGRPGRIPGSISVPAAAMIDSATGAFQPLAKIRAAFDTAGAFSYDRLITYCGGGIAASTTFFALQLLEHPDVGLYDGSLLEWSADPALPLEVD